MGSNEPEGAYQRFLAKSEMSKRKTPLVAKNSDRCIGGPS